MKKLLFLISVISIAAQSFAASNIPYNFNSIAANTNWTTMISNNAGEVTAQAGKMKVVVDPLDVNNLCLYVQAISSRITPTFDLPAGTDLANYEKITFKVYSPHSQNFYWRIRVQYDLSNFPASVTTSTVNQSSGYQTLLYGHPTTAGHLSDGAYEAIGCATAWGTKTFSFSFDTEGRLKNNNAISTWISSNTITRFGVGFCTSAYSTTSAIYYYMDDITLVAKIGTGAKNIRINPAKVIGGERKITIYGTEEKTIQIFTIAGAKIMDTTVSGQVSYSLPKGLYMVKVNNFTTKCIVN